eukprot:gene19566-21497_t
MENEVFNEKEEIIVQADVNAARKDAEREEETRKSDHGSQEKLTTVEIEIDGLSNGEERDQTGKNSSENVITTQPSANFSSTYEDVYRSGNFGLTLGKVNQARGLKWAFAHMGLTSSMLLLSIIGTGLLMEYYNVKLLRDLAIGFTWSNSILGVLSGALAVYFFRNLKKLRQPYAMLMTVRFMAVFNWVLLMLSLIFVMLIAASKGQKAYPGPTSTAAITKTVYAIICIIVIIELVVSFVFVFSPACSEFCDACSCCGGECCIYSEGEEIADGVPNPPSQERWQMVALILQEFHSRID